MDYLPEKEFLKMVETFGDFQADDVQEKVEQCLVEVLGAEEKGISAEKLDVLRELYKYLPAYPDQLDKVMVSYLCH